MITNNRKKRSNAAADTKSLYLIECFNSLTEAQKDLILGIMLGLLKG